MDRKYIILAVIALITIISIGSVSAGWFDFLTGDSERAPDELVCAAMPHGEEPEYGFDPMHGWGFNDGGVEPLIQSTLLKHDHDANIVNDLATDYEVSDDFKTYTVNIRDDVKFTDGSKLTAKDVAFSYNTAKEIGEATDLSMMKSAEAVNDTQVKFELEKPDSTFVHKLTDLGIVPEATYDNSTYGQNPIGSGPYKLAQWDKGQQVILERNDDYYGKKPYYSKITNLFLDRDASFSAVKSGDVDVAAGGQNSTQLHHEEHTGLSVVEDEVQEAHIQSGTQHDGGGVAHQGGGALQVGGNSDGDDEGDGIGLQLLADFNGNGSDHQHGGNVVNESGDDTGEQRQCNSSPLDVGNTVHDHVSQTFGHTAVDEQLHQAHSTANHQQDVEVQRRDDLIYGKHAGKDEQDAGSQSDVGAVLAE